MNDVTTNVAKQRRILFLTIHMSSTRLLPENNDDNGMISSSETGVIVKDIAPHSRPDDDDDDCVCTCSCCPTVSNWCIKDAFGLTASFITWFLFFYAQLVIVFVILISKKTSLLYYFTHLLIFHCLEFLAISSHCRAMFSNPVCIYISIMSLILFEIFRVLYH
jgi:hypothetical protein